MRIGTTIARRIQSVVSEMNYRFSRTLLFTHNPRRRDGPVYPVLVQIQTLNRCNGACAMCPYPTLLSGKPEQRMADAVFLKIVREIAAWKRRGLLVLTFQNEPLLDPRLETFLREAREQLGAGWYLEITTNGSLLDPDRAVSLLESGLDAINVSVNSATAATYGRIMPGLSFERVESNVKHLLRVARRGSVVLRYLKLRENLNEFPVFRQRWQRLGAAVIGYDCNDRLGSVPNYSAIRAEISPLHQAVRRWLAPLVFRTCPFPWSQANILANGDLLMCCHDYRGASLMGNVAKDDLLAIFNADRYRRLRRSLLSGAAEAVPVCAGCSFHRDALWL